MPDPGLTDLIAAHWFIWDELECRCGWSTRNLPSSDYGTGIGVLFIRHLALVVEQHTNGRHEWPKTTPTGHTYDLPTTYADLEHMIGHMVQSEIECWDEPERPPEPVWEMIGIAQQEVGRERARAEKAEATIARVEKLAHDMRGWCSPHGISVTYSDRIRAALEGEQQ